MNRATVFLAAVMTLIGTFYATRYFDELVTRADTLPVIETLGGDFALPATSGGTVSLQQFRGRVVLLNFGFTSCPDVCPPCSHGCVACCSASERLPAMCSHCS
jgi:cytochrome oxidase Cu insertion factor (SCO1/SenC/PrrC family)